VRWTVLVGLWYCLWKDGAMRFVVTSIWNVELLLSTGMEFSSCFHNIPFKKAIFELHRFLDPVI